MGRWSDLVQQPASTGLLTLAEAEERLARAASELGAERVKVGTSRAGRPLELVRIGAGSRRSFWYGGPHANEPLGISTVVELAERLAERPALLGGEVGFDLLLCIDPDSYVLNENWFAPAIDLADYYRGFYRPAMDEWPDWDLPIDYRSSGKRLLRASKLPESLALRASLELSRPAVLNALHNAELGGAFFCVLGAPDHLVEQLSGLPAEYGVPREEAMVDDPGAEPLAPGVFAVPDLTSAYETVLQSGHADPASLLPLGDSAAAWCAPFGTVSVVAEVPYWSVTAPRPAAGETIGEVARRTARTVQEFAGWLGDFTSEHPEYLLTSDPRARSTLNAVRMIGRVAAGLTASADRPAAGVPAGPDAIVGYEVMLGMCLPQRYKGMLLAALNSAGAPQAVTAVAADAFAAGMDALATVPVTAHPLTTLVGLQLAAGLIATDCAVGDTR